MKLFDPVAVHRVERKCTVGASVAGTVRRAKKGYYCLKTSRDRLSGAKQRNGHTQQSKQCDDAAPPKYQAAQRHQKRLSGNFTLVALLMNLSEKVCGVKNRTHNRKK